MHLDSTFDALSNGTNYKFKFHRKVGDFGEKVDFFAILSDFFLLFSSPEPKAFSTSSPEPLDGF